MIRLLVCLVALMILMGCTQYVKLYEGGPGTEKEPKKPVWTLENPPDEFVFERTTGEGENKEVVRLVVKKEGGGWFPNPFTYVAGVFSDVVALLFGTLGGAQPAVGK